MTNEEARQVRLDALSLAVKQNPIVGAATVMALAVQYERFILTGDVNPPLPAVWSVPQAGK